MIVQHTTHTPWAFVARVTLVLSLALLSLVFITPVTHASDNGEIEIGIGDGNGEGGHIPGDGGGALDPKPDPGPPPLPKPEKYRKTAIVSFVDSSYNTTTINTVIGWGGSQCRTGGDLNWFAGAIVHYYQKFRYTYDRGRVPDGVELRDTECIAFQKEKFTRQCVVYSTAELVKNLPNSYRLASARNSSGFLESKNRLPSDCDNASTKVNLSKPLEGYGRYSGTATAYRVPVEYESTYDPIIKKTTVEMLKMGDPYPSNTKTVKIQFDCNGVQRGWSGAPSWTHTDCGPDVSTQPIYQCVNENNQNKVSINGQNRSNATVFRDGKANEINWDIVRPSSNMSVNSATTRWTRTSNSTPWRENGLSVSKANVKLSTNPKSSQLFTSNTGTNWLSGARDTAYITGYWASDSGKPTKIRPSWSYTGTIQVQSARVTGFDGTNWNWVTTSRNVNSSAICHGPYANVTFVRATQGK